ncbi:MAG: PepSY domain-containing protein, partial [Odoribacter sp.]|nr:PepSY domain-containing protein [Odoribacter sp.]
MMSLAKMPEWIVKVHDKEIEKKIYEQTEINLEDFKTDINQFLISYPEQIKNIEWGYFGSLPLYKVVIDNKLFIFNATKEEVTPLF